MSRFVQRDGVGRIKGAFVKLQPGYAEEELADDNAELVTFMTNGLAKTAAELDADKDAIVDGLQTSALRALYLMQFDAANAIRVLQGQPTLNAAQFKAYAKGKL